MAHKVVNHGKTVWRGQIKQDGKKVTKQFKTKTEALDWEAQMRQGAAATPHTNPTPEVPAPEVSSPLRTTIPLNSSPTILGWLTEYLLFARRYSPKVFSEKKSEAQRFLKNLDDPRMPVDIITPEMALKYLSGQFVKRSGNAANKIRKNFVAAWNWGVKFLDGFPQMKPNPFRVVNRFPTVEEGHYVPPEADFWMVYDISEGQDKVLLMGLICTAARKGELFRWQWSKDIDFTNRRIRLGSRKNRTSTMVYEWLPMLDDLYEALMEHREHAINDLVFPQIVGNYIGNQYGLHRGFPQKLCEKAGVKPFGCHGIRGLAATILARKGVPTTVIQTVLRHKKISTTDKYIRALVGEDVRPHLELLMGGKAQKPTESIKPSVGLSRAYP